MLSRLQQTEPTEQPTLSFIITLPSAPASSSTSSLQVTVCEYPSCTKGCLVCCKQCDPNMHLHEFWQNQDKLWLVPG